VDTDQCSPHIVYGHRCIHTYNKPVKEGIQITDAVLKAVATYLGLLPLCLIMAAALSAHKSRYNCAACASKKQR
jgi:hypothetical protein